MAVNEVQQLIRRGEDEQAALKLQALKEKMQAGQINEAAPSKKGTAVYSCIVFLFLFAVMGYLYYRILRPFEKLQGFAENIAQGNFDVPLKYERCNYFWCILHGHFDSMRKEIIKARAAEREAVENIKPSLRHCPTTSRHRWLLSELMRRGWQHIWIRHLKSA